MWHHQPKGGMHHSRTGSLGNIAEILESIHKSLSAYTVSARQTMQKVVIEKINVFLAFQVGFEKFLRH